MDAECEQAQRLYRAYDFAGALQLYRRCADQGHPSAQYDLGDMHRFGHGVAKDYGQALHWYRKAADQGHAAAQYALGHMHRYGMGVAEDYGQALHWWRKAAAQDHWLAPSDIAVLESCLSSVSALLLSIFFSS